MSKTSARIKKRFGKVRQLLQAYGCASEEGVTDALERLLQEHQLAVLSAKEAQAATEKMRKALELAQETRNGAQQAATTAMVARQLAAVQVQCLEKQVLDLQLRLAKTFHDEQSAPYPVECY